LGNKKAALKSGFIKYMGGIRLVTFLTFVEIIVIVNGIIIAFQIVGFLHVVLIFQ